MTTKPKCAGSGVLRTYAPSAVTGPISYGAKHAHVTCPECGVVFVGRIVRTVQGQTINGETGMVKVPGHLTRVRVA